MRKERKTERGNDNINRKKKRLFILEQQMEIKW